MAFLFNKFESVKKNNLKVVGIMNGTSLDGADFVLVDINTENLNCQYKKMKSFSFSKALRNKLFLAATHQLKVDQLALVHHELGRYYANCYKKLNFGKIDLIGLHGQTVFHKGAVASLQIGEPSYLAEVAKCPVVSDFRVADIAVGGQGAPLAPFFHQIVFGALQNKISIHNLGGISNLTLIKNKKVIQGFDTGPANMLIDLEIQRSTQGKKKFDQAGKLARAGSVDLNLVKKMMNNPFLKKKAPKSCGREEFGIQFLESINFGKMNLNDRLATLTEFVALSISYTYRKHAKFIPDKIIFCGGGVNNIFLLERIQKLIPETSVTTAEAYKWPSQSIEAAAFAVLAVAKALNKKSNVTQSTGAKRSISLGKITVI
ncbi:MAG: anhydro-N-acetylmuramic acid kinase [Pseudobdellovibrio sp.]